MVTKKRGTKWSLKKQNGVKKYTYLGAHVFLNPYTV